MDSTFAWLIVMFILGGALAGTLTVGSAADMYAKQCEKQGSFMVGDRVYDCKPREVK